MGNDFLDDIINDGHIDPLINEQLKCPFCNKLFKSSTTIQVFNKHIRLCGLTSTLINKACELYPPSLDYELNSKIFINSKKYIPLIKSENSIQKTLEEKILKLKSEINNKKISWEEGYCQLNLTRNNLLKESMEQIKEINLKKELKINFKGEIRRTYSKSEIYSVGVFSKCFSSLSKGLEKLLDL